MEHILYLRNESRTEEEMRNESRTEEEMRNESRTEEKMRNESRTEEEKLLEDLISYYLEYESKMPVAPLVEHDAELTSFYVRPPMMAYKEPNAYGHVNQSKNQEKSKISSYRELLFGDNCTYRRIYLTADAGMGKTSFSKMMTRTWCQAHKPDKDVADKFNKDDLDTMGNFDFLFLIKLREHQGKNICRLDDMIVTMLQSKLPRVSSYTKPFVEQVLCKRQCLIIVDGLDEWSHTEHNPSQVLPKEVIHTRLPGRCFVLATTRPWKLSAAQLSKANIDRLVEISELDDDTASELESRGIEILKEIQGQKDHGTDFKSSVKILGHIRCIPFVLLHMICLWVENSPVGKSLCEVYSNIIELTLTRWLVKTDSGHTNCKCEPSKEHENIKLKCMENNRHCQRYMPLLLKIGQLALSALFNDIRQESLLFKKEQVLQYLSEEALKQCLDMGLLSQVKNTAYLARVRVQLYFPHKILHEFFCALFIVTNWNNADPETMFSKQRISIMCRSVSDILEMSEVFVFVCGLNPEVYYDISRHLATIVSTDQRVIDYRNHKESFGISRLLEDYQRMQISCFWECTRNQHPQCKIVIEDMFLSKQQDKILPNSACSIKTLNIYNFYETKAAEGIVRILEQTKFSCLESLIVRACRPTLLQSVLTSTAHTLKHLQLNWLSLTDDECSAISTLNNVRSIHLYKVEVSRVSLIVLTLPLLEKFILVACDLGDSTVTVSLPLLTEFILRECKLSGSTVTLTLPLLTKFTLTHCGLSDSTVTLTLPKSTEFTVRDCNRKDSTVIRRCTFD